MYLLCTRSTTVVVGSPVLMHTPTSVRAAESSYLRQNPRSPGCVVVSPTSQICYIVWRCILTYLPRTPSATSAVHVSWSWGSFWTSVRPVGVEWDNYKMKLCGIIPYQSRGHGPAGHGTPHDVPLAASGIRRCGCWTGVGLHACMTNPDGVALSGIRVHAAYWNSVANERIFLNDTCMAHSLESDFDDFRYKYCDCNQWRVYFIRFY